MHWLTAAAIRAGIRGAETLQIGPNVSISDVWEIVSRALGYTPADLASAVAPALGVAAAEVDRVDHDAMALVPHKLARQYHVLPLRVERRKIVIATADPTNLTAEHAIGFATGRNVEFVLAAPGAVEEAIIHAYGPERELDRLVNTIDEQLADAVRVVDELSPESLAPGEVDSGPVVKLTNLILRDAVKDGASDIHFEPNARAGVVRFRVDGVMRKYMQLSLTALNRVVSRIKVLGRMDIADRQRPQDGRTRLAVDGKTVDLRISTVCTRDSEKAVIRILHPESTRRLEELQLPAHALDRLRQLLSCREGIVIVTGPTGSGKTTTLYSAIREMANGTTNISTVEDPVEYELAGITQIQVDQKRGITFANSLRALLRQDPDIIFIGEIRDTETAQIAARAAMTGHLVLATLHTNDAVSAVTRLIDLGLDRQTIAATLRGTVAQRLMRCVCTDCAQSPTGALTEGEEQLASRYGAYPLLRAVGCAACGTTGYRGRFPVVEVAVVTPSMADMIAAGATRHMLQRIAVSQGMVTIRDSGIERVRAGDTTLQELDRVVGGAVEDPASGAKLSVVLVSADEEWRRIARSILERSDVQVAEAADESEAEALMKTGEFVLSFSERLASRPVALKRAG